MDNDELKDEIVRLFGEIAPDKEVEFLDDWDALVTDEDDAVSAVRKVLRRLNGRLAWFWRWWYRPKRIR